MLKKGDPLIPKNYRPVALLPIFSKILERLIFNQLVNYLDSNSLIHPNHHGSRPGHSTSTALIQMYDSWVEEVDNGNMVGVMMVDLSAAFDMVDQSILLQKLELFGLDVRAVAWLKSYLTERCQSVFVDGCLSPPMDIVCGVPQGSILGSLLYILYTNDIPDIAHNHPVSCKEPSPYCHECGGTVCYVDDSTYSLAESDPEALSRGLTAQYKEISKYMAANKLVINADKTHLLVLGIRAMVEKRNLVSIQADEHNIRPSKQEKLLGCIVSDNLKWRHHILEHEQSLIRQLTSRVNGLSIIASKADFTTKLMVANGLIISKICYLIQLWGGCEGYLLNALQIQMNKTARIVTGFSRFTSTRKLMRCCGWLTVKQLVVYQTTVMVHKTLLAKRPFYLHTRLTREFSHSTRQCTNRCIRIDESFRCKSDLPRNSFRHRGANNYNALPADVRTCRNMSTFKSKLKRWIMQNKLIFLYSLTLHL